MKRVLTGLTRVKDDRIQVEEQVITFICSGVVRYERTKFQWRDIQDGDAEKLRKINSSVPASINVKKAKQ